ncbi:MAG TPA: gamma-glutamyl-gamma-aminobutyrate hydrolase family protein [Clostridia bacterium]|nr:gamma-glutamyl-gamma-aminobutyrate hydrolase family protein [Clostridia bacterium]
MFNGKPIICITSDSNQADWTEKPRQLESPKAYSLAVARAGGIPWLASEVCEAELAQLCDGLLLSGGDDVHPKYFGEAVLNASVNIDAGRDEFEMKLIPEFLSRGKPILCICRGIQALNIAMGGDIYQDLVAQCGFVHMNKDIRHTVYAEPGTLLHELFGGEFRTNSTHHQAVRKLAPGFKVAARSAEGVIEAIEHESLPIYGCQFHPERLTGEGWDERTPDFAPLFARFVEIVGQNAANRAE